MDMKKTEKASMAMDLAVSCLPAPGSYVWVVSGRPTTKICGPVAVLLKRSLPPCEALSIGG